MRVLIYVQVTLAVAFSLSAGVAGATNSAAKTKAEVIDEQLFPALEYVVSAAAHVNRARRDWAEALGKQGTSIHEYRYGFDEVTGDSLNDLNQRFRDAMLQAARIIRENNISWNDVERLNHRGGVRSGAGIADIDVQAWIVANVLNARAPVHNTDRVRALARLLDVNSRVQDGLTLNPSWRNIDSTDASAYHEAYQKAYDLVVTRLATHVSDRVVRAEKWPLDMEASLIDVVGSRLLGKSARADWQEVFDSHDALQEFSKFVGDGSSVGDRAVDEIVAALNEHVLTDQTMKEVHYPLHEAATKGVGRRETFQAKMSGVAHALYAYRNGGSANGKVVGTTDGINFQNWREHPNLARAYVNSATKHADERVSKRAVQFVMRWW